MEQFDADLSLPLPSSIFGGYPTFVDLPLEIVSIIFSFLNYPTLQTARLVCKSWYNASLDPKLKQKEYFVLGPKFGNEHETQDDEKITSKFEEFQNVIKSKESFNLKIKGHKYFTKTSTEFWKSIGDKLKALSLKECGISEDKLISELQHCPRLKCLTLDCSRDDFRAVNPVIEGNLFALEILEVSFKKGAELKFTSTFLDHAPNLKSMRLDVALFSRGHWSKVALAYWLDYFQHHPHVTLNLFVKALGSRRRGVFEDNIVKLILLPNVRLRMLHTNFLPESITNSHQPSLRDCVVFVATGEDRITSVVLESMRNNFPNLRRLALHDCDVSPEVDFRLPGTLTRLHLDFNSTEAVTEEQLLAGLCFERNTTLTEATFVLPNGITNTFFIRFAESHPSMTFLHLLNCNFNDQGLQAIIKHQPLLQYLFIDRNDEITDAGLSGEKADDSSTGYHISRLTNLQRLYLEHCPNLTASVFREIALPRVRVVSLAYSKVPLAGLVHMIENNPSIEELHVQRLDITDEFVYYALEKLPHLKLLNISECGKISDKAKSVLTAKNISRKIVQRRIP